MPRVPRLNNPIEQRALPGVRVDTQAPLEAFGGGQGLDQVVRASSGATDEARRNLREQSKELLEAKKAADDLFIQELGNKGAEEQLRLLWDMDAGALHKKGVNAVGIVDTTSAEFGGYWEKLEAEAKNAEQRAGIRRVRLSQERELKSQIIKHQSVEFHRFSNESTDKAIQLDIEHAKRSWYSALTESGKEAESPYWQKIQSIRDRHLNNAKRLGQSPAVIALNTERDVSRALFETMQSMADEDQHGIMEKFYLENKDKITNTEYLQKAMGLVESPDRKGRAESQRILNEFRDDKSGALRAVDEIDNPRIRQAAKTFVEGEYNRIEEAREQQRKQTRQDLYNQITTTREMPVQSQMESLTPEDQNMLRTHFKRITSGEDIAPNPKLYYQLKTMFGRSKQNSKMYQQALKYDLTKHLGSLPVDQWEELVKEQTALKDPSKSHEVNGILSKTQIIDKILTMNKVNNDTDRAEFFTLIQSAVVQHEEATGRKATPREIEETAQGLVREYTIERPFWFDGKVRDYQIKSVDQIPEKDRKRFEQALKADGVKPSPGLLIEMYKKQLREKGAE